MNLDLSILAMVIPVLLLIEGFFSGSEVALLSADPFKLHELRKKGHKGAEAALRLIQNPSIILSTTLLTTAACVVSISSLIAVYFEATQRDSGYKAILVSSTLVVILGELIPKSLFRRYAKELAPTISLPILGTFYLFYPITSLISKLTSHISGIVAPIDVLVTGKIRSSRHELIDILQSSRKNIDIRGSEQRMIKRILDFKDSEAKNALIPLVDVVAVSKNSTVKGVLLDFDRHRHSRIPVYQNRIDNIIGILEIWDLFQVKDLEVSIEPYIRPVTYFAETQTLESVFKTLSKEAQMGVVVDEHGGATGILTFEDIVEEVVGDIKDEDDSEMPSIRTIKPKKWMVQARTEIQVINEQLGLSLAEGEYETLAGYLLEQFGHIPKNGDHLEISSSGQKLLFTIRQASPRRIELVVIESVSEEYS